MGVSCRDSFLLKAGGYWLGIDVSIEDGVIIRVGLSLSSPSPRVGIGVPLDLMEIFQDILDGRADARSVRHHARGTEFQKRVWDVTGRIPYGSTATYKEIARAVGCGSPRAVGQALKANPVPLLVPCHRVIGAGGTLTGFSSGLEIKELLLRHEHENCSGK